MLISLSDFTSTKEANALVRRYERQAVKGSARMHREAICNVKYLLTKHTAMTLSLSTSNYISFCEMNGIQQHFRYPSHIFFSRDSSIINYYLQLYSHPSSLANELEKLAQKCYSEFNTPGSCKDLQNQMNYCNFCVHYRSRHHVTQSELVKFTGSDEYASRQNNQTVANSL